MSRYEQTHFDVFRKSDGTGREMVAYRQEELMAAFIDLGTPEGVAEWVKTLDTESLRVIADRPFLPGADALMIMGAYLELEIRGANDITEQETGQ